MNQSVKAVLTLLAGIALVTGGVVWFALPVIDTTIWVLRFICPVVGLSLACLLIRSDFKQDLAPDYLRSLSDQCLERGGICFVPIPTIRAGVCHISFYFQNRYERPCEAFFELRPAPGSFKLWSSAKEISVAITVGGAAFGVVHVPYPIGSKHQGHAVQFFVGANVRYPKGRGRMLRFREGQSVGSAGRPSILVEGLATVLFLLTHFKGSPTTISLVLPEHVAEVIPLEIGVTIESLAN